MSWDRGLIEQGSCHPRESEFEASCGERHGDGHHPGGAFFRAEGECPAPARLAPRSAAGTQQMDNLLSVVVLAGVLVHQRVLAYPWAVLVAAVETVTSDQI